MKSASKADVLTALAGIFVDAVFDRYHARARRDGITDPQCGSVNFVQRFGSLNLHVHFHLLVLDAVFARDEQGRPAFHPAPAPTLAELEAVVARTARRSIAWLGRRDFLDDSPRKRAPTRKRRSTRVPQDDVHDATEERPDRPDLAVERDGFNLHVGVRIDAGDDLGRARGAILALHRQTQTRPSIALALVCSTASPGPRLDPPRPPEMATSKCPTSTAAQPAWRWSPVRAPLMRSCSRRT